MNKISLILAIFCVTLVGCEQHAPKDKADNSKMNQQMMQKNMPSREGMMRPANQNQNKPVTNKPTTPQY